MGAWSKAVLGWVEVEEVGPDALRSVLLGPVLQSQQVLRVPAMDGSREYLLLENRQRIGSDVNLEEPGLLIWHVDQDVVDLRWTQNAVNVQSHRMGVRLVEADGQRNLTSIGMIANRGDPGDPFPGCIREANTLFGPCTQNRSFHVGTHPAARAQSGAALGIALTGIELVGAAPYDVSFQLDTRFTWDTILVAQSAEAVKELSVPVQVSGVPGPVSWHFASGTLPPGLSFHPGTMSLTGSTFQTGTWEFVLRAADGPNREILALVTLQVVPPGSYRWYRFVIIGMRSDPQAVGLSELQLLAGGNVIGGATATSPGSEPLIGTPADLVDGSLASHWFDINKAPILLDYGTFVAADSYRFGTGGMSSSWDPSFWRLEASRDGTNWKLLDEQNNYQAPVERGVFTEAFTLVELPPPDDFRITSAAMVDNGNSVRLTWISQAGASYRIETSPTLDVGSWNTAAAGIPSAGASTTYDLPRGGAPAMFYRIARE